MLTDYNFAKSELTKAGMNLTPDQHHALSTLYEEAKEGVTGARMVEGEGRISFKW